MGNSMIKRKTSWRSTGELCLQVGLIYFCRWGRSAVIGCKGLFKRPDRPVLGACTFLPWQQISPNNYGHHFFKRGGFDGTLSVGFISADVCE